jgi:mRNA interferase MazF
LARFVRGDVVAVPFPVSGRSNSKPRPALIVASWLNDGVEDYLVCAISGQPSHDPHFMELTAADFAVGSFARASYVRPNYLFAIDEASISRRIGMLTPEKLDAILSTIASLFH